MKGLMQMTNEIDAWNSFFQSGSVLDYLQYKAIQKAKEEKEAIKDYQIHIPIPQGAKLLAVGYDGAGRQLWTRLEASPQAAGDLEIGSAARYKLFLLQGDGFAPLCPNWDSAKPQESAE